MNRLHRYVTVSLMTAALAVPAGMAARAIRPQDSAHDAKERAERQEKAAKAERKLRVYDAKHKDYHDWTTDEDRSYRGFLSDRHEEYREFNTLKPEEQQEYWEFRHEKRSTDDAR